MRGHWCRKGSKWEATEIGTSRSTFSARVTRSRTSTHRVGSSRTAWGVAWTHSPIPTAITRMPRRRSCARPATARHVGSSTRSATLPTIGSRLLASSWVPRRPWTSSRPGSGEPASCPIPGPGSGFGRGYGAWHAARRHSPTAGRSTSRLVGAAYLLVVALSGLAAFVFLAGLGLWAPQEHGLASDPLVALWFVVATMGWSLFALQDGVLTGLRQTVWVPIENTIFAVAKIVLLAAFALSLAEYGIFASWTIPAVLSIIPVNLLIFRRFIPRHQSLERP